MPALCASRAILLSRWARAMLAGSDESRLALRDAVEGGSLAEAFPPLRCRGLCALRCARSCERRRMPLTCLSQTMLTDSHRISLRLSQSAIAVEPASWGAPL